MVLNRASHPCIQRTGCTSTPGEQVVLVCVCTASKRMTFKPHAHDGLSICPDNNIYISINVIYCSPPSRIQSIRSVVCAPRPSGAHRRSKFQGLWLRASPQFGRPVKRCEHTAECFEYAEFLEGRLKIRFPKTLRTLSGTYRGFRFEEFGSVHPEKITWRRFRNDCEKKKKD